MQSVFSEKYCKDLDYWYRRMNMLFRDICTYYQDWGEVQSCNTAFAPDHETKEPMN